MRDCHQRSFYRSALVEIGRQSVPVGSRLWGRECISGADPAMVFPRTPFECRLLDRRRSLVASANHVLFFNSHNPYVNHPIAARAESSDWIGYRADVVADATRAVEPHPAHHPLRAFVETAGPGLPRLVLMQRRLVRRVEHATPPPDALEIEEVAVQLLLQALGATQSAAAGRRLARESERTRRAHRDAVHRGIHRLTAGFCQPVSLADVAAAANVSPSHFCVIFKRHVGESIHRYLQRLRLYHAADLLEATDRDTTQIALDVGFSSRAHFSDACRRLLGHRPSDLRRLLRSAHASQIRRIVDAAASACSLL